MRVINLKKWNKEDEEMNEFIRRSKLRSRIEGLLWIALFAEIAILLPLTLAKLMGY